METSDSRKGSDLSDAPSPVEMKPETVEDISWFQPNESYWCIFYHNPQHNPQAAEISPEEDEENEFERLRSERERLRKWIGALADRRGRKVIVRNNDVIVDMAITAIYNRTKQEPVLLPCFLTIKVTAWVADAIDYSKLQQGWYTEHLKVLERRQTNVESLLFQHERELKKMKQIVHVEPIIIVFDYQNYSATCRERNEFIPLPTLVGKIVRYPDLIFPRRVRKVVIVDFFKEEHRRWKHYHNYEFVEVPSQGEGAPNPTDQYLCQAALRIVSEYRMKRGVFCLVSGDHHFIPLLNDIKLMGLRIMIVSQFPENIPEQMKNSADYYMDLFPSVDTKTVSQLQAAGR